MPKTPAVAERPPAETARHDPVHLIVDPHGQQTVLGVHTAVSVDTQSVKQVGVQIRVALAPGRRPNFGEAAAAAALAKEPTAHPKLKFWVWRWQFADEHWGPTRICWQRHLQTNIVGDHFTRD